MSRAAQCWRVEAKIKEILRAEDGEIEQDSLSDAVVQDLDDEGFEVQPETLSEAYRELVLKERIDVQDMETHVLVRLV